MAESYSKAEAAVTSDLIKARRHNGCYSNSFNPSFQQPSITSVLRWMLTSPNHTNLPRDRKELDEVLPVIKHQKNDIFRDPHGLHFMWIGHASCLVQIDDFIFLTDPVFGERCGATPSIGPKRFRPSALTVDDLPDRLDAVLISHNHFDHLDYPTVSAINERYGNSLTWFCGEGGRQWFLDCRIQNVVELNWWEKWEHPKKPHIQVAFCPAQHWSRRSLFDRNKTLWGGYAVWNRNYKFYFAGDTGYTHNIEIFKQIGREYGPFDLSAIPIGAYEPRWMMEAQHVSPDEAVRIHLDTRSKRSIAIHWGTWALANEYFLEPRENLRKAVHANNLPEDAFVTIKHGEIVDIPKNN